MIFRKIKKNLIVLVKVLFFVYSKYTAQAFIRDLLCILSSFAEIFSIKYLGKFIDSTVELLRSWEGFVGDDFLLTDSFKFLMIMFILWMVSRICTQLRAFYYVVIQERILRDSKEMMINKIAMSNMEDVEKVDYQDLVTYVPTFSIGRMIEVYDNSSIIFSNIIRLVGAIAILCGTMGFSVLLIVLFVLPEIVSVHFRRNRIRRYRDDSVGKLKYINYIENLCFTISNFLELRVNNIYKFLRRRYVEEYSEYLDGFEFTQKKFYMDQLAFSILGQALKFGYIVYVLMVSVIKRISFGTFKALFDYVDVSYKSIFNIFNSVSILTINLGYIGKFFDLVGYEGFGDRYHGKKKLHKTEVPLLEMKDLSFAYPDDPECMILKSLNIVVGSGEKVAIIGGDGSGKSSIVKILTGLYTVSSGNYSLGNIVTKELDRGELKSNLSVIFQDYINYNFSVKENVVISGQRENVDNNLYKKVCKVVELDEMKKRMDVEDSSILGKVFPSGKDLSPGYWQRLAIARMLYRNKNIFIMDEPFTFIDEISAGRILDNVFKFLGKSKSLVYITRNKLFLERFDKVYYLENGKVVESGTWRELMKMKGRVYDSYGKS